jgi:acyl-CoA synthetase (AMP-forming)/AMP-acid ligase II
VKYHPGATLTPDQLCAYLYAHIAAFKVPQRIWTSEEPLPRLGTEKIDKVSLRAKYRAIAEAEAAAAP